MHEMSLIDYALTAVENKAEEMNIEKVAEVGLVIGRLAALPELMEKAFEVVRTRHPKCADARLHLDMNPRMPSAKPSARTAEHGSTSFWPGTNCL